MKNYISKPNTVIMESSYDVLSGGGVRQGSLFGVAHNDALTGVPVACEVEGIFELPKLAADNMTKGLKVNFNIATKELQLATSSLDNVATVVEAAGAAVTKVKVRLTPV